MPRTTHWGPAKDIVNGTALTSLIFAVSLTIPILGAFAVYALPLPILFYRAKLGRKKGAIIPIATLCLISLIIGTLSFELLFVFELLLIGFVLAELMEMNLPIEKTVLYTCAAVIISAMGALLIYGSTIHTSVFAQMSEYVAKNLDMAIALYREIGMAEEDIQVLLRHRDSFQYILTRIIPSLAAATTLILIWANILMAKAWFNLRGITFPDFGDLKKWKAPDMLVWGVITGGVMLFLPAKPLLVIGLNCLIILMTIYFFQGIAVVSFYFEKKQFSRSLRVFLYSIGFITLRQLLIFIVSIIGLFDIWVDFRKLDTNLNNQENG